MRKNWTYTNTCIYFRSPQTEEKMQSYYSYFPSFTFLLPSDCVQYTYFQSKHDSSTILVYGSINKSQIGTTLLDTNINFVCCSAHNLSWRKTERRKRERKQKTTQKTEKRLLIRAEFMMRYIEQKKSIKSEIVYVEKLRKKQQ